MGKRTNGLASNDFREEAFDAGHRVGCRRTFHRYARVLRSSGGAAYRVRGRRVHNIGNPKAKSTILPGLRAKLV